MLTQEVEDRTILVCTRGSYFDRIEYDGRYEWNTTCTGIISGEDGPNPAIFNAIKVEKDGSEHVKQLDAKSYRWSTINNHGISFFEFRLLYYIYVNG